MNKILKRIYDTKEGLFFGALAGFLIGKYLLPYAFDLQAVASADSILNFVKTTGTSIIEFAKTKIIISSTICGALIGAFVDDYFPEGKFWRKG